MENPEPSFSSLKPLLDSPLTTTKTTAPETTTATSAEESGESCSLPPKNPNDNKVEPMIRAQNLGDFIQFGRYTIFVIVLYELVLLPMVCAFTLLHGI
jgi:hypothetical protein